MKTKLIKFSQVLGKWNKPYKNDFWVSYGYRWIELVETLLITKEANTSRQSDYKQALGFERFHYLSGRLQNNF